MVFKPAPWRNFHFGGYYLRQTRLAKIEPNFMQAMDYMASSDLKPMCQILDILAQVPWAINNKILETMEYVWSIGGGLGKIPNRYNARLVTPKMIQEAEFVDKLKLLKEF